MAAYGCHFQQKKTAGFVLPPTGWYSKLIPTLSLALSSGMAMAELPQGSFAQTCLALGDVSTPTPAQTNLGIICGADGRGIASLSDRDDNTAVAAMRHEEAAIQGTIVTQSAHRHLTHIQGHLQATRNSKRPPNPRSRRPKAERSNFFIHGGSINGKGAGSNDETGFGEGVALSAEDAATHTALVQGQRAFDVDGHDLTLGMDRRLDDEKTTLGVAFGYDKRDATLTGQLAEDDDGKVVSGGVKGEGVHLSGYMSRELSDAAYLDTAISVGNNDLTVTRPVPQVTPTGDGPADTYTQAVGRPASTHVSASIGSGYKIVSRNVAVTPYTRVDYTKATIDAYEESVRGVSEGMKLRVNEQDIESLMGSVGVKASKPVWGKKGTLYTPHASLEISHEFANDARDIMASLPAADGLRQTDGTAIAPSAVRTNDPDRTHATLGAGVSASWSKGQVGFVNVEVLRGNEQYTDTAVKVGYQMDF